jgi:pyruvate-formate lyase
MHDITLRDLSLKNVIDIPRADYLKDIYFAAYPQIDTERPRWLTKFFLKHDLFKQDEISLIDTAKAYRYVLENRDAIVHHSVYYAQGMERKEFKDKSLFAGSTTSKFKGVIVYPEFLGLTIWPELWSLSERKNNPFQISEPEVIELNRDIFPHWLDFSIQELTRKKYYNDTSKKSGADDALSEMEIHDQLVFFMASKIEAISHTIPDFSRAIYHGLGAVIDDAQKKRSDPEYEGKEEFFEAVCEVLHGIINYSKRLADKANEMVGQIAAEKRKNNPEWREEDDSECRELREIEKIHRHVPEHPARNFREGLTTVWLCWIACHLENANAGLSLGRLDQVLYRLYEDDIEAKKEMDEKDAAKKDALELVCCLWLKIGDHVPLIPETGEKLFGGSGSNQAITLGGVDAEGKDAVNELTYIMLKATELMELRDPNLNARYCPGMESQDQYLKRLCEVNIKTGATPAIHNDKAIIDALMERGDSLEQARDYGVVGCVEPCSAGRAYSHTGALLINLPSVLELTLFNGRHRHTGLDTPISIQTGDPMGFKTFEDFKTAFADQTRWLLKQATNLNNNAGKIHQKFHKTPILSALFKGPMKKGLDLIMGGAEINSSAVAIIGLADVADSLSAIEQEVYNGSTDFDVLMDAINNNFKGHNTLWARLKNQALTPKWGNQNSSADDNVAWVLKLIDDSVKGIDNYRGGFYRVGYWTMTVHAGFGKLTKALPSGRKDYENFSSGFTPASGKTPNLMRTLHSVASMPSRHLNSGVAFNVKYTPEAGPQMLDNFVASVKGYFDGSSGTGQGGIEIQFNVTDRKDFEDAVQDPDKHSQLLVRVSGYTAYFKDLNPQMQKEIIDRTEYLLSTGGAQIYAPFQLPGGN